jgi:hypothetical protein
MELDVVALTLPPPSIHFIEDRVLQKVRSGLAIQHPYVHDRPCCVSRHLSEGARLTIATRKVKHDLEGVRHPSCLENDVVLIVRERSGELHRVVLVRADASAAMLR